MIIWLAQDQSHHRNINKWFRWSNFDYFAKRTLFRSSNAKHIEWFQLLIASDWLPKIFISIPAMKCDDLADFQTSFHYMDMSMLTQISILPDASQNKAKERRNHSARDFHRGEYIKNIHSEVNGNQMEKS